MQLEYVIYRRVLRYYSGEEDALGEYFDGYNFSFWTTYVLSDLYFFLMRLLFRHEKSIISGCGEEVCHPPQKASYTRWIGVWLGLFTFKLQSMQLGGNCLLVTSHIWWSCCAIHEIVKLSVCRKKVELVLSRNIL